jgi:hypothetical protein
MEVRGEEKNTHFSSLLLICSLVYGTNSKLIVITNCEFRNILMVAVQSNNTDIKLSVRRNREETESDEGERDRKTRRQETWRQKESDRETETET